MAEQTEQVSAPTTLDTKNLLKIIIFVVIGIFATTLPQPQVLGKIPLQHLLKAELHVDRSGVAFFFLVCGLFWYIKPIAGILTDAFPLAGTRRRSYALLSAGLAALAWLGLIFAPHEYGALLIAAIIVNLFMVMLSTVIGAVLVEIGHSTKQVGKLTAVRQFVSNLCGLIQGPLGGLLASGAFGIVCGVNALILLPMVPATYFLLKEKRVPSTPSVALGNARTQFGIIGKSATFWWALIFISLFYFAPGIGTLLYFRQNDVLKFDQQTIGWLSSIGGLGGILGAVAYGLLSHKFSIRTLLIFGTITAAITSFLYLKYDNLGLAYAIDFTNGLFFGFAEVAFIDLAARATPVGCEGLGYSLILSSRNLALFGADFLGSLLADKQHWSWDAMVILNGGTTLVVLVLLPFLPKAILGTRDRSSHQDPTPA